MQAAACRLAAIADRAEDIALSSAGGRGIGLVANCAHTPQDGLRHGRRERAAGIEDDGATRRGGLQPCRKRIRLLTNNPRKVAALAARGIEITGVVPLKISAGEHNRHYLATKRDRSGHQL